MINQQLLDYIKQQLQQGTEIEKIDNSLIMNGWQASDIKEAFDSIIQSNRSNSMTGLSPQSIPITSMESKKGISKTLIVAFLLVGFFMIGGGVFAYFNYFQQPSPEKIFQGIINNFNNVNYLEYSGELKIGTNANSFIPDINLLQQTEKAPNNNIKNTSNFLINFSGVSDTNDLNDPKASFSFNINTDVLSQSNLVFGLDAIFVDKVLYVKPRNLPNVGFFDVTMLSSQWIKIDTIAEIKKEKNEAGLEEAQDSVGLSPEQIQKIENLLQEYKFFKITGNLADEQIEGVNTYHLKFLIDKEETKKLLAEIMQTIQDKIVDEKQLKEIDESFKILESLEGEVWVGKKDLLPYKISLISSMTDPEKPENYGNVDFTLSFKNFNKPVKIEIPSPVKTIQEIISSFIGSMPEVPLKKPSLQTPATR